jgi:dihydrofolate synthase / folylpolyglutamate synthase
MNYKQTLDYLFAQLPMFHRIGAAAYKADLVNTKKIMALLGKPYQHLQLVHIAGTNGKGSSSHMLAAILQQAGYKTGLYTSPHLVDFRERIKINGKMIPKNYVVDFVEKYSHEFEKIAPSFFEWTVGLAFKYFEEQEIDVAIIEVGLGGRLDSTNVITPLVSLITNISYDHMNLLGNTLEEIAGEKAGIIKSRIPTVVSQYQLETGPLFSKIAKEKKASLVFADKIYKVLSYSLKNNLLQVQVLNRTDNSETSYELDLKGNYQSKNLLGVLATVQELRLKGFIIEEIDIKKALAKVSDLTGLAGRWQTLSTNPPIIADTAHNEEGIVQVVKNLKNLQFRQLHWVLGTVNDKDVSTILSMLPKDAEYYFVKSKVPRALPEEELKEMAIKQKLIGNSYSSVLEGLNAAKKAARKEDLILICGSNFIVGEVLESLQSKAD